MTAPSAVVRIDPLSRPHAARRLSAPNTAATPVVHGEKISFACESDNGAHLGYTVPEVKESKHEEEREEENTS